MTVSFFGLAATLDPTITLVVFVTLIACLIILEHTLDELEVLAHEAGYSELVKKVYKEMMIMGVLGFGVFMAFNVFPVEHDEKFLAFELAHMVVFFMGILLVMRALLAIYISHRSTTSNWIAHNASCASILDRINSTQSSCSIEAILYKYFNLISPLQHMINYKMLEDYFHKDFNISCVEFRFVDYLTKHNVYYAMELTEVSLQSWLAIVVVIILNFIRIEVHDNGLHNCTGGGDYHDDHHDDDHQDDHTRRALSGDDAAEFHLTKECANFGMSYFLFCGGLLIFFGFLVCFANYWSERKVAIVGKYWTHDDQISKLQELRNTEEGRSSSEHGLKEKSENVWHVCSLREVLEEKKIEEQHHHISQERMIKNFFRTCLHCCWQSKAAHKIQTVEAIKSLKNANKAKLAFSDFRQSSLMGKVLRVGAVGEEKDEHPLLFEFDEPLFFNNRKAHKFLTECFQMLMALYFGMYLTNYLFVTQHSSHFGWYLAFTLVEMLVMLVQMSFLQDTACSLLAVTSLLNEAADVMCEEDHIKAKVLPKIRQEIEELTPDGTSLQDHLLSIYKFVNFDGDDSGIGSKEFSSLLFTVDLILPDNEVDILFRAVDTNGSGNIEFSELFELFHPNSTLVSMENEDGDTTKMKMLSHQTSMASVPVSKKKPHTVVPMMEENKNQNDAFTDVEMAEPLD